jgi:hypothetical protein
VPGAISNAIYNACGVRIREHPITREKIMAGLVINRAQRNAAAAFSYDAEVAEASCALEAQRGRA